MTIHWGDGESTTIHYGDSAGSTDGSGGHVYVDDFPTGTPFDFVSVGVTVVWSDGKSAHGAGNLKISNAAPAVVVQSVQPIYQGLPDDPDAIYEGSGFVIKGRVTDVGRVDTPTATLKIDLNFDGDTNDAGEQETVSLLESSPGNWTFEHTVSAVKDDGATYVNQQLAWGNGQKSDSLPFTIEVKDDDTGLGVGGSSAEIRNFVPVMPNRPAISFQRDSSGYLLSATVNGQFGDAGAYDFHKVRVNWGDGVSTGGQEPLDFGSRDFAITRTFAPGSQITLNDIYNLTVDIVDDDGGSLRALGPKPVAYEIRVAGTNAEEDGEKDGSFVLTISPPPQTTVIVSMNLQANLAIPVDYHSEGSDYSYSSNYVRFLPGETQKAITITPVDDAVPEENEQVQLHFESAYTNDGSPVFVLGGLDREIEIIDDEWRWITDATSFVSDTKSEDRHLFEWIVPVATQTPHYLEYSMGSFLISPKRSLIAGASAGVTATVDTDPYYPPHGTDPAGIVWSADLLSTASVAFAVDPITGSVTSVPGMVDDGETDSADTGGLYPFALVFSTMAILENVTPLPPGNGSVGTVNEMWVTFKAEVARDSVEPNVQISFPYIGITPSLPGAHYSKQFLRKLMVKRGGSSWTP